MNGKAKTRYLLVHYLWIPSIVDTIKERGGEIFSISCASHGTIRPRQFEIWFYCSADEWDIAASAGVPEDDMASRDEEPKWLGKRA